MNFDISYATVIEPIKYLGEKLGKPLYSVKVSAEPTRQLMFEESSPIYVTYDVNNKNEIVLYLSDPDKLTSHFTKTSFLNTVDEVYNFTGHMETIKNVKLLVIDSFTKQK